MAVNGDSQWAMVFGGGLNVTPECHRWKKFTIKNVHANPPQPPTFRPPFSETTVRWPLSFAQFSFPSSPIPNRRWTWIVKSKAKQNSRLKTSLDYFLGAVMKYEYWWFDPLSFLPENIVAKWFIYWRGWRQTIVLVPGWPTELPPSLSARIYNVGNKWGNWLHGKLQAQA